MIPQTMLAARFPGDDQIEIIETAVPQPGPGEALLLTRFCGLCGSDRRLYHRGTAITPGHELTATVVQNGPGATLPEGARVVVYIKRFCGACRQCRAGMTNRCAEAKGGLVGWQTPGGYAQYLTAPAANCIPLPDDIGDDEGVLLLDTIGTAAHGIHYALAASDAHTRSQRAAIVGVGPLGLGSQLILSALGWAEIGVYDPNAARVAVATEWGATALDLEDSTLQDSFGLVIEASGQPAARELAMRLVESGGAVLMLGENDNPWTLTPSPQIRRKEAAYVRTFYFPLSG
ncbi:MAG: alcohol dehydrogenase catalytic domain-containing protein [Anaerolineae bacterium]|nr:alcohol dehydrogenase catalytic domain-containing protein [Anaerolineae bacterium]